MRLHWIEMAYDGQPAQRAEGRFGHYMVRLTDKGCRLVCFRVESDEIAGSLSPVPTIAEAQGGGTGSWGPENDGHYLPHRHTD
jgi:hypothetical protein